VRPLRSFLPAEAIARIFGTVYPLPNRRPGTPRQQMDGNRPLSSGDRRALSRWQAAIVGQDGTP
jgi:hypothetical protein